MSTTAEWGRLASARDRRSSALDLALATASVPRVASVRLVSASPSVEEVDDSGPSVPALSSMPRVCQPDPELSPPTAAAARSAMLSKRQSGVTGAAGAGVAPRPSCPWRRSIHTVESPAARAGSWSW